MCVWYGRGVKVGTGARENERNRQTGRYSDPPCWAIGRKRSRCEGALRFSGNKPEE